MVSVFTYRWCVCVRARVTVCVQVAGPVQRGGARVCDADVRGGRGADARGARRVLRAGGGGRRGRRGRLVARRVSRWVYRLVARLAGFGRR